MPAPEAKVEFRRAALARRDALDAAHRAAASAAICRALLAEPGYQRAERILIYASMRSEVDTAPFIAGALADGKHLAYPLIDWDTRDLRPVELAHPERLVAGRFGVPEPPEDERQPVPPDAIDLVLVPGVAFDLACYRLGYGAGMYDRLLAALPHAPRWAPAFEAQVVDVLPVEPHDLPVDLVLTERRRLTRER